MPHLSAPLDEGPFTPRPRLGARDRVLLAVTALAATAAVLAYAFLHASALR